MKFFAKIMRDGKKITKDPLVAATQKWLLEAAITIENQAIYLSPVRTGRLRGSITYATRTRRSRVRFPAKDEDAIKPPTDPLVAYVGTNVEYAEHVEYGTKRQKRQSFLRLGLDMKRRELEDHFRRLMNDAYSKR